MSDLQRRLDEENRKANQLKSTPIGFLDGNTNNVEDTANSALNTINTGKGFIDGSVQEKIERRFAKNGRRIIELGKRFENAFGFVGNTGESLQETGFSDEITSAKVLVRDGRSSFEYFKLTRPNKTKGLPPIELMFAYTGLIKAVDDVFAPPPLVSFKSSKRIGETIVSTNFNPEDELKYGQVVEQYGAVPIAITIRGLLIDMVNHKYPSNKVRQLTALFNYNGIWEVEGQVFGDKGIKSIYFTDLDEGGVQGYEDTWSFTLDAKSIVPIEFAMKPKK